MKEGWEVKRLEDLLTLNQIGLVRNKKEQDPEFEFRYFKMDNIRNDNGIKEEGFSFINASAEEVTKYSLRNGDLLFNTRNSFELVGKSCLYTSDYQSPTIFNNNIMRMRFIPDLTSSYAAYAFSSELVLDQLEKIKSGTTSVVGIYFKTLKNIQIPVPPLAEQEAIVEVLDKAFAAIDQAKANIEQNIANAKELFQSKLNQIFSKKGKGWVEKTLGDVFKLKSGDGLTAKKMIEGPFPVYGGNGVAGYHNEYNFSPPQVIVGRVGALCGNVRMIEEEFWLTDNAFRISCGLEEFDYDFVTLLLNHKNLRSYARQAAQPVVSNSSLKNVSLSFPTSIETQTQISKHLRQVEAQLNIGVEIYKTKLASLDELKKSILQKAFAGELT